MNGEPTVDVVTWDIRLIVRVPLWNGSNASDAVHLIEARLRSRNGMEDKEGIVIHGLSARRGTLNQSPEVGP
jgi:hypothetical protein